MKNLVTSVSAAMIGLAFAGPAQAQEVLVTQDIETSTTWVNTNTYNLQNQIYVRNGATLTIEAGTVIATEIVGQPGQGGSLAVARGSKIMILGTATDPVIMTSKNDVATWTADAGHPTGGDPSTGSWRQAATEWGNLTIMGNAYIAENQPGSLGNSPAPSASNEAFMEGLTEDPQDPGLTRYGGGDDDDDSGTIQYLSIRYGGRVIELQNELNGLSLGGIGNGTDISFLEIMNNVDDGIEIWGGTVDINNFTIWNVGDDSFDVDQGWRGRAQFGLIVQGYSLDAVQGSGVGDNAFEFDGAEDSDYQPVTSATLYNMTVVGQPFDGDHAMAFRDNARVQYRNCVFTDIGDELVRFDGDDGDGASGYGHNGTTPWFDDGTPGSGDNGDPNDPNSNGVDDPDVWDSPFSSYSTVNPLAGTPGEIAAFYRAQTDGNLCEVTDSVFHNCLDGDAFVEARRVGVIPAGFFTPEIPTNQFDGATNNVIAGAGAPPIRNVERGDLAFVGPDSKAMARVTALDPRASNAALVSADSADPADGFWSTADYRGAFDGTTNWALGWTAADAFGFYVDAAAPDNFNSVFDSCFLPNGELPFASATGTLAINTQASPTFALDLENLQGPVLAQPVLGGNFATAFGLPLPLDLSLLVPSLFPAGCNAYVNPAVQFGFLFGVNSFPIGLNNDPSLVGITIGFQWYIVSGGVLTPQPGDPLQITTTNLVTAVIQ